MKLVTIQHKKVLDILMNNKIYTSELDYIFNKVEIDESSVMNAYQFLMQQYGFKKAPIFCNKIGIKSTFNGTKSSSKIILELNVPDNLIKIHSYNLWMHLLYAYCAYKVSNEFIDRMHDLFADDFVAKIPIATTFQAVIPYIHPDWLVSAYKMPNDFISKFSSSDILLADKYKNAKLIYGY